MRRVLLCLAFVLAGGCAHELETPLRSAPTVVTRVNLHADPARGLVYSTNYLLPERIPMCTEVVFGSMRSDEVVFRVPSTGRTYTYLFHRSLTESPEAHLARYFGPRCDRDRAARLGPVDQEGIRRGEVMVGMSKEGVVFAIGYPPPHETPRLEGDQWRYWKRRFDSILVHFEDGRVARIVN